MTEWYVVQALVERLLTRGRRTGERGYTTEFVVVTAAIIAAAITITAIIAAKTIGQANNIQTH